MDYLVYQISSLSASAEEISAMLPPEEQAEASRRGGAYGAIRLQLRLELSRRTRIPPDRVKLTYNDYGKPDCMHQPFNISHSGDCLCMAFHHKSIGVDVERIRTRSYEALATRFMSKPQLDGFRQRGCRQDEFFACWCAAEAIVKHAGDTMWHALQYPFRFVHGRIVCDFPNAPEVQLFQPMPGYCGAVAYSI